MKDRDKIDWQKVGDLVTQYDYCVRVCNELQCLENCEAAAAVDDIRREIIEEVGGKDMKG